LCHCNGVFPILISIITCFFVGSSVSLGSSLLSAVLLAWGKLFLGILTTFGFSQLASKAILKAFPLIQLGITP